MNLSLGLKAKTIPPPVAKLYAGRYDWLSLELAEPNLGAPPDIDVNTNSSSEIWVLSSNYIGTRGWASYDPLNFPFISKERPDLTTLGNAVDEVIYKDPDIIFFAAANSSFSPSLTAFNTLILEPRQQTTWSPATLSWGTAKVNPRAITTYYLNISGPNSTQSQWVTGDWKFVSYLHPGLDQDQPYQGFLTHPSNISNTLGNTYIISLTAEDWDNVRRTKTFTVLYKAPIFFGIHANNNVTDAVVLGSSFREPRPNLSNTFTINAQPNSVYYYIAYPVSYGTVQTTTVRRQGVTTGGQSVTNPRLSLLLTINGIENVQYILEVSNQPLNIDTPLTVSYT
jgi:hypothetical protein